MHRMNTFRRWSEKKKCWFAMTTLQIRLDAIEFNWTFFTCAFYYQIISIITLNSFSLFQLCDTVSIHAWGAERFDITNPSCSLHSMCYNIILSTFYTYALYLLYIFISKWNSHCLIHQRVSVHVLVLHTHIYIIHNINIYKLVRIVFNVHDNILYERSMRRSMYCI